MSIAVKSVFKKLLIMGSLVIVPPIIFCGTITSITPNLANNPEIGRGSHQMQNSQVPPTAIVESVNPSIIAAKQINYTNFEETKKVATFKVKVPKRIPQGYHLTQLQHMRPDLPNIPETVHNDTVSAIYSNGQNQFTIIQGYFSGGDVPKGPQGSMEGTTDVSGVKAKWVEGSWAIVKEPTSGDPSSQKEWRTEPLRLGWYKDNLGYSILTDGLKLRDLVQIANSLE